MQTFTHPSLLEPPVVTETPAQRREKRKLERAAANMARLEEQIAQCTHFLQFPLLPPVFPLFPPEFLVFINDLCAVVRW